MICKIYQIEFPLNQMAFIRAGWYDANNKKLHYVLFDDGHYCGDFETVTECIKAYEILH